ncbi:hypothetical protein [Nitratiruptor tergarcus]|uniref:Uncharacterized protein n=1 Tax=Nitratiruptor tergarcus DSM 16512 TaxID=1069081 RepID=A0A1W1WSJ5_9BACT|nr:hypothetical protein [Nitratiruptor tergarcus]SMC09175.1 hypothetical protein SAMN05660197_0980 [Nitratiruptor tergarcus DSM 16512]
MYMFIVVTILIALSALAYYLYIKHKGEHLSKLQQGICPECEEPAIYVKNSKKGGCSGTSNVVYKCSACGYEEDFNLGGGSCSNGSCGL